MDRALIGMIALGVVTDDVPVPCDFEEVASWARSQGLADRPIVRRRLEDLAVRVWEVERRVIGTTCSYAWATQAGLRRWGSNVTRISRVRDFGRSRRGTTVSLLRWRRARTERIGLERRTQKWRMR